MYIYGKIADMPMSGHSGLSGRDSPPALRNQLSCSSPPTPTRPKTTNISLSTFPLPLSENPRMLGVTFDLMLSFSPTYLPLSPAHLPSHLCFHFLAVPFKPSTSPAPYSSSLPAPAT